jgi:hypothetical protein
MSSITTATLKVPGASLYYEVTGSGPLLLMIPGAPADAGVFAALAAQLADRYTVVDSYRRDGAGPAMRQFVATMSHTPDIAALREASPRIVVGAGDASAGQMPHQAALALAERLGVTPVSFPGDHQGFATDPAPFADTAHKALRQS